MASAKEIFEKKGRFIIYKHSTTCSVSIAAEEHVNQYMKEDGHLEVIVIDVHKQAELKMEVAEHYGVKHESPQILLIEDQECKKNFSHFDVTLENLKKL